MQGTSVVAQRIGNWVECSSPPLDVNLANRRMHSCLQYYEELMGNVPNVTPSFRP